MGRPFRAKKFLCFAHARGCGDGRAFLFHQQVLQREVLAPQFAVVEDATPSVRHGLGDDVGETFDRTEDRAERVSYSRHESAVTQVERHEQDRGEQKHDDHAPTCEGLHEEELLLSRFLFG